MSLQIFINLPVADLPRARGFFKALGFTFNEEFCDDTAACVVISEHIYTMLLTHAKSLSSRQKLSATPRNPRPQPFLGKAMSLFMDCDKICGDQFENGLASLAEVVAAPAK